MEKISIIIPVYNVEQYIEACLCSVINQTYRNLEIICIDDCGYDMSVKFIDSYMQKDARIKLIRNCDNLGLPMSRNVGLKAASGEYIFFLDSDDYLEEDIIEKMYLKIKETGSDIVVCGVNGFPDVKDNKELIKESKKSNIRFTPRDRYKIEFKNFEEGFSKIYCMAWGKLYSTEFLRKNELSFVNQNVTFEDNGFHLKVISCFPVVSFIEDQGIFYRIRKNSITGIMNTGKNRIKKLKDMKYVLDDAFQFIKNQQSSEDYEKIYKKVENLYIFPQYFKRPFWYHKIWNKYYKRISILGFLLYKQQYGKTGKLFGFIPICNFNRKKDFNCKLF